MQTEIDLFYKNHIIAFNIFYWQMCELFEIKSSSIKNWYSCVYVPRHTFDYMQISQTKIWWKLTAAWNKDWIVISRLPPAPSKSKVLFTSSKIFVKSINVPRFN